MRVHQRKNGRWFGTMKKLWLVLAFLMFVSGGASFAEEKPRTSFTLGVFTTWSVDLQTGFIEGFTNGIIFGCHGGAGELAPERCSPALVACLLKVPGGVRSLLLEIAKKDKYKELDINVALSVVLTGCSKIDEFDYALIYGNLDTLIEAFKKGP